MTSRLRSVGASGSIDRLNVRARHQELIEEKAQVRKEGKRKYEVSLKEFRKETSEGKKKWTVINGSVYDIGKFTAPKQHPGGDFLDEFIGLDASLYFYTAHMKSENVWRTLRAFWVGYLIEEPENKTRQNEDKFGKKMVSKPDRLASKADRSLMDLIDESADKGLFHYPTSDIVKQIIIAIVLQIAQLILCMWAYSPDTFNMGYFCACAIAGTLGYVIPVYMCHDGGHQSIFDTKKKNENFIRWAGLLLANLEMPETCRIHDYHHAFPNVVDRDHTLNTGFFKWHSTQIEGSLPTGYSIWAPILWYTVALSLYGVFELISTVRVFLQEQRRFHLLLFGLRAAIIFLIPMQMGYSWHIGAWHYIFALAGGYSFALISTFNHLAEPKETVAEFHEATHVWDKKRGFVDHQMGKTRSVTKVAFDDGLVAGWPTTKFKGPFVDFQEFLHQLVCWSTGHFNYHNEHHCMPYMPRQSLRKIAHRIREIADLDEDKTQGALGEEGYRACSYPQALRDVVYIVGQPLSANHKVRV